MFKMLVTTPTTWQDMKVAMMLKYDTIDKKEFKAKL